MKNVLTICLLSLLAAGTAHHVSGQVLPAEVTDRFHYREIGPTRQSGRFVDFAVVESSPKVFYAATASGHLWKTKNNGITFEPQFQYEDVFSIGDVAVSQSDTSIVYVGTGEANNSRSSYWGNGVYRSDDGGLTWEHKGLPESHHIGRILIHPDNPDILYVAALGHLYSDNPERGLYKSTDGGDNWKKILAVRERRKDIGVVDVAMHPEDPNTLIAATFDKIRTPWTYNPGGPGSAIYRSTDAGENWEKLEGGLPTGFLGRIGVAYASGNPEVVYANIENVNVAGMSDRDRLKQLLEGIPLEEGQEEVGVEMYRSDDGGDTWRKISPDGEDVGGSPAYYYQQVRVDPTDEDHVYVIGIRMWESVDGGENWTRPFNFGGDNHAMWINPDDPDHILLGYDHGMGVSYDGGDNWYHTDQLPLAQFYAIGVDMERPYNVYGGLQDNGSVKGPSTKRNGSSIRLEDWKRTGGGDGMYNVVDPTDSRWLYNESQFGPLTRHNQVTGESERIAYQDREMRWNWNAPVFISPHDPKTLYHAGNKVVKSTDRGDSWTVISPDLTTNDPEKIRGTGNIQYSTITSMAESPLEQGTIWVGTDDGNIQVTRDDGKNWELLNENIPGNPGYWVSRVEPSAHIPGRAYISYTGYRRDDFRPFVYRTDDYGKSWIKIVSGLPDEPVNVIKEDPVNPNLLFLGTEMAVYVSIDGGENWSSFKSDMPTQPVHDLIIHPREYDLVAGTHGRGIWITNIKPLQELNSDVLSSDFHLFQVRPKVDYLHAGDPNSAYINFEGESEPLGPEIWYWTGSDGDATIVLKQGEMVLNEYTSESMRGMNLFVWDKQRRVRKRTEEEKEQYLQRAERFREWIGEERYQQMVAGADWLMDETAPGNYTAEVTFNGQTASVPVVILKDEWHAR